MNIAIVGCGSIATVHARCIEKSKIHKLVAFADIIETKAKQFADKYKGNYYKSYEEMLQSEEIDVLHICTPHYLHVPMTIYALEHGVHVFMEKPPVISLEQLKQLELVQTDRYLGFCFQNRYNPSILYVKKLLESGEVGQIYGARGMITWNRPSTYYTQNEWRGRFETEGGGVLINQSIHTLDLLVFLLGIPVSVEASMANHHLKSVIEVEDTTEAWILFEKERRACFYATTAYLEDVPPILEIVCEKRTIRIEDLVVTHYYKDARVERNSFEKKERIGKSYWGDGHMDCILDFYNSIEKQIPYSQDLSHMKKSILLMLGMYQSAKSGKEVEITEDGLC